LETLENKGITVYPSAKTLRRIQDKGIQKEFYDNHQIPTAPFKNYAGKNDLLQDIKAGQQSFPFVWKSRTGGYDGRGVAMINGLEDLEALDENACLAEKKIPFKNELSVIVARSPKGEVKTFPVVEMEFHPEANQVEYVICPARIADGVAQKARKLAEKVSQAFGH